MQSFSNIIVGGNLGDDPVVRGEKEKLFAYFSLAIDRTWRKEGMIQEATDWIRVTVPTKLVPAVQNYVRKGDPLVVEGEFRTHHWTKGEEKHFSTYVLAKKIRLVKSRWEKEAALAESDEDVPLDEAERETEAVLATEISACFTDENHMT